VGWFAEGRYSRHQLGLRRRLRQHARDQLLEVVSEAVEQSAAAVEKSVEYLVHVGDQLLEVVSEAVEASQKNVFVSKAEWRSVEWL
jgi:hypothetical protein